MPGSKVIEMLKNKKKQAESQKYHTHDDMMGLIDSLKWYLMGSLLIRLGGFLFIVLQLNIVILVADLTKVWTILMCI